MTDPTGDDPRAVVVDLDPGTAERVLELLRAVVGLGVADAAGVAERRGVATVSTLSDTDGTAAAADSSQAAVVSGPSIDAGYLEDVLSSDDVRRDGRWPRWSEAAAGIGVAALISVRLYSTAGVTGLLTLYRRQPAAITDEDRALAAMTGIHLTALLVQRHGGRDPSTAAVVRHLVAQAQGVLVERLAIGPDEAFVRLHRMAREDGVGVADVARRLVDAAAAGVAAGAAARVAAGTDPSTDPLPA